MGCKYIIVLVGFNRDSYITCIHTDGTYDVSLSKFYAKKFNTKAEAIFTKEEGFPPFKMVQIEEVPDE